MSRKARLFLVFTVLALAVSALRFVSGLTLSSRVTDFAGGLGVGLLIGVLVTWEAE